VALPLTFDMFNSIIMMLELLASAYNLPKEEMYCMAEAIYFEARSEEYAGQIAVGNVINNRVKSPLFPNTICKVVHQGKQYMGLMVIHRCQFSYYCDGRREQIKNMPSFLVAVRATIDILVKKKVEIKTATHYHTVDVQPAWSNKLEYLGRIGKHEFYR
tara:strand:+ start:42 stop:518 length:477 start_codon:yes stop_codon:yes gene_type:complete